MKSKNKRNDLEIDHTKRVNSLTDFYSRQLATERERHKTELIAAEQAGFKRGLTFIERNQKTGEILVRYDEEHK